MEKPQKKKMTFQKKCIVTVNKNNNAKITLASLFLQYSVSLSQNCSFMVVLIKFKIICIELFMKQSLQSSFTGN